MGDKPPESKPKTKPEPPVASGEEWGHVLGRHLGGAISPGGGRKTVISESVCQVKGWLVFFGG